MTHTISDGATSATLTYDSEHARITQLLTAASTTATTNYLNDPVSGTMAEKVVSGSTNTWNDYLMVDGKLVGERICSAAAPTCAAANATWQYFILDHLGSVSVVTDGATAAVTARESFDAWGKQRNPDWSDNVTCSAGLTSPTTRGLTGQEEIAALCLVNLNARLYDPNIGRFLAADSVVPDPQDGQSYNRYSYVDNRPLSLTDPTGHGPGPINEDCGIGCIIIGYTPAQVGGIVVDPGVPRDPPHGTMSDIDNFKGGPTSFQQFWVAALTVGLGAKNVSVAINTNGNLALKFTCSGGNEACISAGRALNSIYGGTETFVGGEDTEASSYSQGESPDTWQVRANFTNPRDLGGACTPLDCVHTGLYIYKNGNLAFAIEGGPDQNLKNLIFDKDGTGRGVASEYPQFPLAPPTNVDNAQFAGRLIVEAYSYNNALPYNLPEPQLSFFLGIPYIRPGNRMVPGQYNSNSFAAGVLDYSGAGSDVAAIQSFLANRSVAAPGLEQPIPQNYFQH